MKGILQNKWVKFGVSAVSFLYAAFVLWFAFNSFVYELVVTSTASFAFAYILLNLAFFVIMFYSRKQVFTSFISMILLPVVFFIVVMNLSNPLVFIPPLAVSAVMFFASRNHETVKTILATVYILMYILGIIAFLIVKLLFGSSVEQTRLTPEVFDNADIMAIYSESAVEKVSADSVSPDGTYRYYVVDVDDKSIGRILINVEYNNRDKIYSSFRFVCRGYEKKVAYTVNRGTEHVPSVKWVSDNVIEYQFPGQEAKRTEIGEINKDLFEFLYE